MDADSDCLKLANDSGFPLQIAIERAVGETSASHGWKVRYTEHAWVNASDKQSGFADLVLEDRYGTTFLVVECKRVRQATWLFMNSTGQANPRRNSKAWVSHYANGRMAHFGWEDIVIDPPCPESIFCAVRGQSASDRSTLLERVGGELVSATEAIASEERDFRPQNQETIRLYFNIIVTTAELKVAKFNAADISLSDGTMPDAHFDSVPFVRFRKQLSMHSFNLSPSDYERGTNVSSLRENTVFVVRADALLEFLQSFDIPNSSLNKFHHAARRQSATAG
jgi:hypothetical protein